MATITNVSHVEAIWNAASSATVNAQLKDMLTVRLKAPALPIQ